MLTSLLMLSAVCVGQSKAKSADKPLVLQSNAHIQQAVFHPDGKRVYFLTAAGVEAHDVTTGQRLFAGSESGYLTISPDGKRLALVHTIHGMISVHGNVVVLDANTGKEQHKLGGTSAAFSPDGRWLVALGGYSFNGKRPPPEVRITDLTTGKTHPAKLKYEGDVPPFATRQRTSQFRFGKDGTTLIAGVRKENGQWVSLAACDLATGKQAEKLPSDDQLAPILDPQASADGKRFVNNWQVFDESGQPIAKLEIPKTLDRESQAWGREIQLSPDAKRVFGVSHSRWKTPAEDDKDAKIGRSSHLQVWDAATGKWRETVFSVEDVITLPKVTVKKLGGFYRQDPLIVVNRQATLAISYNARGAVKVWDLATRKPLRTLRATGHSSRPEILAFNADGSRLASASTDGEVVLWDTKAGEPLRAMERAAALGDLHFRPKSPELVGVGHDLIYVWNTDTGKLLRTFERKGNAFHFAFHPAGKLIAVADYWSEDARLLDIDTGKDVHLLPSGRCQAVAFHPDGKSVLTVTQSGVMRSWEVATGKPLPRWREDYGADERTRIQSARYSADGTQVLLRENGNVFTILDAKTGKIVARHSHRDATSIWHACWRPDGKRLAVAYAGNRVVDVCDPQTGALTPTRSQHRSGTLRVCYSPDGTRLASTGYDHLILISSSKTREDAQASDAPKLQRIADAFPGHVHPAICVTKSGAVLVAHFAEPAGRIHLVRSPDGGRTWKDAGKVPDIGGGQPYPGALNTLRNGHILLTWNFWVDPKDYKKGRRPYFALSNDEGKTWSPPHKLPVDDAAEAYVRHAIWERATDWVFPMGDRVIRFNPSTGKVGPFGDLKVFEGPLVRTKAKTLLHASQRSADQGRTWTPIKQGPRMNTYSCDMIALDNGWVVHAQPAGKGVNLVVSYDDGLTWTKRPWQIAEPGRTLSHACHLTQLDAGHIGLVMWDSNRKQPGGIGVYFARLPIDQLKKQTE